MEKKYSCNYNNCKAVFSKQSKLIIHLRIHTGERPFQCQYDECKKNYTSNSHLKRHLQSAHSGYRKTVACPKCKLLLSSKFSLRRHFSRVHNENKVYPFECKDCMLGFYKKRQLTEHMYIHTGIPAYSCNLCEMQFTSLGFLKKHKRNHKTYTCICEEIFTRWSDLQKHQKLKHKKAHKCDICNKCFSSNTNLKNHCNTHSEIREAYKCPKENCSRFYTHKKNLIRHLKTNHEGNKFKCIYPNCNKELSSKQKLRDHNKTHLKKHATDDRHCSNNIFKTRKLRKDIGTYKCATSLKLSGLSADSQVQKQMILGNINEIEMENLNTIYPNIDINENDQVISDNPNELIPKNDEEISINADCSINFVKDIEVASVKNLNKIINENNIKMIILDYKKIEKS